jgi:hypothetical protein
VASAPLPPPHANPVPHGCSCAKTALRGGGPGGELGGERGALLAHIGGHVLRVLDRLEVRILGAEARRARTPEARRHEGERVEERGAERGGARTLGISSRGE